MEAEGHSGLAAGASTCPARGRRERDAQPEACQRCSSGRSLSRSVLNPLRDLPGRVRVDGSARCDVRATRRQWGSGLVLPHHLPGAGLRDVSCCWVTCKERQRRRAMELAKTRSWL
eukprot:jgi/Tetstr1/457946/TSEL_044460.t2